MSVDKSQYIELVEKRKSEKVADTSSETKRAAEILLGKLGTSPEWDKYKQGIAKKMARLESMIDAYKAILVSHSDVDHDTLMRAKIGLHSHQSALEAYRDALDSVKTKKVVDKLA